MSNIIIKQIDDKNYHFINCKFCGNKPIIKTFFFDLNDDRESEICCSNEKCNNSMLWLNESLDDILKKWNNLNSKEYIPINQPTEQKLNSCFLCRIKNSCAYGKHLSEDKQKINICKDFYIIN